MLLNHCSIISLYLLSYHILNQAASRPLVNFLDTLLINATLGASVLAHYNSFAIPHNNSTFPLTRFHEGRFTYDIPGTYPQRRLSGTQSVNHPINRYAASQLLREGKDEVEKLIEIVGDEPLDPPNYDYTVYGCHLTFVSFAPENRARMMYSMLVELYEALQVVLIEWRSTYETFFTLYSVNGDNVSNTNAFLDLLP